MAKNPMRLLGWVLLVLCLVLSASAHAQVTAQITDAGGQSWNNGTWSVQLVYTPGAINPTAQFLVAGTTTPVPNQMQSGTLNSTGNLSVNLIPNNGIVPAASAWRFQVCPQASSPCFVNTITITSANQVVTSFLVPPAIAINAFNTPPGPMVAYSDSEIASAPLGLVYWNVTLGVGHVCSLLTGGVCTWSTIAGGSGLPAGPTTPNVPFNLSETPSSGMAGLPTWMLPGTVVRAVTGATNSDTILTPDCSPRRVDYQGSLAVAVTLPTATTLGVPNCVFRVSNDTSPALNVTITPTTWTISNAGSTLLASLVVLPKQFCQFSVDPAGNAWDADCATNGSGISGLTQGFVPEALNATTPLINSPVDDSITIPAAVTLAKPTVEYARTGAGAWGCVGGADQSANPFLTGVNGLNSNYIVHECPGPVSSPIVYVEPGSPSSGVMNNSNAAGKITQSFSGDASHSATVTTGSGTSIGSTSLCSTVNCPAGTYVVSAYLDITTACATTGTYIVNLIYTDDQGSKTVPINIQGTGTTPATGSLALSSTANFGQAAQILRSTGAASINYSTTAGACGSGGPMVGKLYLSTEQVQ